MATYLQGITDYIPDIQPYQPDFNILGQALQTKEAQYQKGYDSISGIYGTLLNSQLTHGDNIERRNEYFTQIQNEIQKIAGLDLSRVDNVNAAKQVFKPLIDDKYLHRDMVFTKSVSDARRASENHKNCVGENCDGDWWEEGDAAIAYRTEEFANGTLESTLNTSNVDYVPFYNAYEMAMDYAKEMGFAPEFISSTPDGKYRVKTTGGMEMVPALWQNMQAVLGQKQELRRMYETEAYVTRKNYVKQHAQEFGGEEQAERQYFSEIFAEVETENQSTQAELEKQKKQIENSKALVVSSAKTPSYPGYDKDPEALLLELDEQKQIIDANKKDANYVADLSNPTIVPQLSVEQLRSRADSIYAMGAMTQTFQHAASTYAELIREVDVKADEYELLRVNHQYRLTEQRAKAALDAAAELNLAEQLGVTEAFVTPAGSGQNDPDYDAREDNKQHQEELNHNVAHTTQQAVEQLLVQLNHIIKDDNRSPAEKATAQKLIEENFGNLIIQNIPGKELGLGQSLAKHMKETFIPEDDPNTVEDESGNLLEKAIYNTQPFLIGKLAIANIKAVKDWWTDEKIPAKTVIKQEGVVTKQTDGTYAVSKWSSLEELAGNPNSQFNTMTISNKVSDIINNNEEFNLLIKGSEAHVKPILQQTLNQINASKTLLKGYQDAELNNNKAVMQYLKGSRDGRGYSDNAVLNEALDIFLDDNGRVRSLEQFAEAIQPILDKYPDENLWDAEEAIPYAAAGNVGGLLGMGIAAHMGGTNKGNDMVPHLYEKIAEDYNDVYNITDVPELGTQYTPLGGSTGVYSEGIGYIVDTLFGAAPNNIAASQTLMALTQNGMFSSPTQQGAIWMYGDASNITEEDYENALSSEEGLEASQKVQALAQQFAMDFLTANPKDKKDSRPRGQIISYGIAANDPDKVAITFKLSQAHVKTLQGSEKRPGVHSAFFGEDPTQATFSIILPKEKLMSYQDGQGRTVPLTMMERHTSSPEEKIFNLQGGNYSVNYNFNERDKGSKADFQRQKDGTIISTFSYYDYNEDLDKWSVVTPAPLLQVSSTFKEAVDAANATSYAIYKNNLETINNLRRQ